MYLNLSKPSQPLLSHLLLSTNGADHFKLVGLNCICKIILLPAFAILRKIQFAVFVGVTQVVMTGIITNQCVEGAVRDAADKGFLVTLVPDACAAQSQIDHDQSLKVMKGFARIRSPDDVVREMNGWQ